MKGPRRSLRTRIIVYAGMGLVVVLAVTTLQAIQILSVSTRQLLTDWRGDVQNDALLLQARVEADQLLVDRLASELQSVPITDTADAGALMRNVWTRLSVFGNGLIWVGPDGKVAALVSDRAPADVLPADPSQVMPPRGSAWRLSGLVRTQSGRPVVVCAIDGGQSGALLAVGDLESGKLNEYLPMSTPDGHAAVIDSGGWVLASNREDLRFTRNEHPEWVARMAREGRPTVGETNSRPQERHMMAFAPVGTTGWNLVFGEPASLAFASRGQLVRRVVLLGLVAVLLVIAYAWLATESVIEPLRRLTSLAQRIASGDLTAAVAVTREDEVGVLAQAFETMRQGLVRSRTELGQALAETRRREEETAALYAVSQETMRSRGDKTPLQVIADRARELTGAISASICLAEVPGEPMRSVVASFAPDGRGASLMAECAHASQEGQPFSCPLQQAEAGQRSVSVPIPGKSPGMLCVVKAAPGSQDGRKDAKENGARVSDLGDDQRLLTGLADLTALAVAQERLHAQSRQLVLYAERERIARDLHDSVSQSLSYMYSQLELLQDLLPSLSADQIRAELRSLSGVASVAFEAARESIYSLRSAKNGHDPLPSAIAGCVRDFTARTGIAVEIDTDAVASASLSPETEAQLVRVVQEALSNVAKHAGATRVAVTARRDSGDLKVVVQDNGIGFDPGAPRRGRRSFGLEMMRERLESVGGKLEIQSRPGSGTRVEFRVAIQP